MLYSRQEAPCNLDCDGLEYNFSDELDKSQMEYYKSLLEVSHEKYCSHTCPPQPLVCVAIGNNKLCAIVDTGAELSLVSEEVIAILKDGKGTNVAFREERLCAIVGLSGVKMPIKHTEAFIQN